MKPYLDLLEDVLTNGQMRKDRTGTGTIGVFGRQVRYDLTESFPLVTSKKMAWRSVVSELLWFIEGSGDERRLAELLHGTRDEDKKTIWTDNATAPNWQPHAEYPGDLGRVYGVQWRHWRSHVPIGEPDINDEYGKTWFDPMYKEIDQLSILIQGIQADPYGRRHILTAWNPGELKSMALPPCHCFAQFYVADNRLSCQMYQRSCDMFLGVPFNIASYSLLTALIAQVCGLDVGEFVHVLGDAHIYLNHIEQVKEQLKREPLPGPGLDLNTSIRDITKFTMQDIRLVGYVSHPSITAEMSV